MAIGLIVNSETCGQSVRFDTNNPADKKWGGKMKTLSQFKKVFRWGEVIVNQSDNFKQKIKNEIPNHYGVYLIYDDSNRLIYIGKSGEAKSDGSFSDQKLPKRIAMGKRENGEQGYVFFPKKMKTEKINNLKFQWFITCGDKRDKGNELLPATAEANLIQEYFNTKKKLPPWNKTY